MEFEEVKKEIVWERDLSTVMKQKILIDRTKANPTDF